MQHSTKYIFLFSVGLCLACSLVISITAVALRERQETNELLEKRKSVLYACWLAKPSDKLTPERVNELFENLESKIIDLETGDYVEGVNPDDVEPVSVEANPAGINEVKPQVEIYHVLDKDGKVDMLILPIFGNGLWGPLYGYVALKSDADTIAGLTYYAHKETPGLGAEVDNPKWKSKWPGREVYNDDGEVAIHVIKGPAANPQEAPFQVDGLSGATLTSRGVTNMFAYWFSDKGYRAYLDKFLKSEAA